MLFEYKKLGGKIIIFLCHIPVHIISIFLHYFCYLWRGIIFLLLWYHVHIWLKPNIIITAQTIPNSYLLSNILCNLSFLAGIPKINLWKSPMIIIKITPSIYKLKLFVKNNSHCWFEPTKQAFIIVLKFWVSDVIKLWVQ